MPVYYINAIYKKLRNLILYIELFYHLRSLIKNPEEK
jgi:hypothetical protein